MAKQHKTKRGKKASFKNWRPNPIEDHRKEHQLWLVRCKSIIE